MNKRTKEVIPNIPIPSFTAYVKEHSNNNLIKHLKNYIFFVSHFTDLTKQYLIRNLLSIDRYSNSNWRIYYTLSKCNDLLGIILHKGKGWSYTLFVFWVGTLVICNILHLTETTHPWILWRVLVKHSLEHPGRSQQMS